MGKITAGGADAIVRVGNSGIGEATFSGLVLPSNLPALAAGTLAAAAQHGARGMVYRMEWAVIASAAPGPAFYGALSRPQRNLPVAFVVSEAQAGIYSQVVRAGAAYGLIRAAFRCPCAAAEWVRDQAQVLAEHRAWIAARQSCREAPRTHRAAGQGR